MSALFAFGDSFRPFTPSFWGTRLPDNAIVDTADGPWQDLQLLAVGSDSTPTPTG